MTTTPIYAAISLVRVAVGSALQARTGRSVWWQSAPGSATRPFVVFQSQDNGGRGERQIGALDWSGLIVVKAIADTMSAAEALLAQVAPGMEALSTTGYNISAAYDRPIVLPPDGAIHQSAHQWRVSLHRS
jgi:hypothetical protein